MSNLDHLLLNGSFSQEIPFEVAEYPEVDPGRIITINAHPHIENVDPLLDFYLLNRPHDESHAATWLMLYYFEQFIYSIKHQFESMEFVSAPPGTQVEIGDLHYTFANSGNLIDVSKVVNPKTKRRNLVTNMYRLLDIQNKGQRQVIVCHPVAGKQSDMLGRKIDHKLSRREQVLEESVRTLIGEGDYTVSHMSIYPISRVNFWKEGLKKYVRNRDIARLMTSGFHPENKLMTVLPISHANLRKTALWLYEQIPQGPEASMKELSLKYLVQDPGLFGVFQSYIERLHEFNDGIVDLAKKKVGIDFLEQEIRKGGYDKFFAYEMRDLLLERNTADKNIHRELSRIFCRIASFNSQDQLSCIEQLFGNMGTPSTTSYLALRQNSRGLSIYPKRYLVGFRKVLYDEQAWGGTPGGIFTIGDFNSAMGHYLQHLEKYTGETGGDLEIQKRTVTGSYESSMN